MPTVDYEEFFSQAARLRTDPALGALIMKFAGNPNLIGLHGGIPAARAFPLTGLSFETKQPPLNQQLFESASLTAAQQYNMGSRGFAPLLEWTGTLTKQLQAPLQEVETVLTSGATQALEVLFSNLLDPGDTIICEEFTWSHSVHALLTPQRVNVLPVRLDEQGLSDTHLEEVLTLATEQGKKPKAVYLIPTAQNPTGVNMTADRKKKIYKICQAHNLLILEDDAYFWLQWPKGSSQPPGLQLPRGFLSLDTDGRVIRVDTFSKVLGPGFRLGWISAPKQFILKAALTVFGSTLGPCSVSQVMLNQLLRGWGMEGFEEHVKSTQAMYAELVEGMAVSAERHLKGLAEWDVPTSGMFMWIRILGIEDVNEVLDDLIAAQVVVVPGNVFRALPVPHGEAQPKCPYVRVSFAPVSVEQLEEGFARIGKVLKARAGLIGE